MANVVADSVVVKREPGRQSEFMTQICFDVPYPCPPLLFGPNTGYESVYLVDGPVQADGYEWYLAATNTPHSLTPEYVGWIPVGDESGPWVVPEDTECPEEPIELSDVTYSAISRLELLACLGDRELTLRGWHPAPPTPDSGSATCRPLEGREFFCSFDYNLLRTLEGGWAGAANALDLDRRNGGQPFSATARRVDYPAGTVRSSRIVGVLRRQRSLSTPVSPRLRSD